MKTWLSKYKKVLFAFIFIFVLLIISGYSIINMTSNASDDKCNGEIKEWSLIHPKARDPDAFPGSCETSLNLERLRQAESLEEIYELAEDMEASSVSDLIVMSKAATEYMKQNCPTYDCAMQELKKMEFKNVKDITEKVNKNLRGHRISSGKVDKAIDASKRASLNFFSPGEFETVYGINFYFRKNKIIKVSAQIFYNPIM